MMSDDDWRALSLRAYETASGYTRDSAADVFEIALANAIDRAAGNDIAAGLSVLEVS
jgi:hypothetical protein